MVPSSDQLLIARPTSGFVTAERGLTTEVLFRGFTPDGTPDNTFGTNGVATLELGQDCFSPSALAPRGSGFISSWNCMGRVTDRKPTYYERMRSTVLVGTWGLVRTWRLGVRAHG